jgi:hypothetical protein
MLYLDDNQMLGLILAEYPHLTEEDLYDQEDGEYNLGDYPTQLGYDWVEGKGWQHEDDWVASGELSSDNDYPIY